MYRHVVPYPRYIFTYLCIIQIYCVYSNLASVNQEHAANQTISRTEDAADNGRPQRSICECPWKPGRTVNVAVFVICQSSEGLCTYAKIPEPVMDLTQLTVDTKGEDTLLSSSTAKLEALDFCLFMFPLLHKVCGHSFKCIKSTPHFDVRRINKTR